MSDINVTPLVDVMLVLVVILIITAPLLVSSIRVELPKTAATNAAQAPQAVALSIDKSGQLFVDAQATDLAALGPLLRAAAQRNPLTEVQLRADTAVPYGRVVEVMGLAHQAGLSRIGFVTETVPATTR